MFPEKRRGKKVGETNFITPFPSLLGAFATPVHPAQQKFSALFFSLFPLPSFLICEPKKQANVLSSFLDKSAFSIMREMIFFLWGKEEKGEGASGRG